MDALSTRRACGGRQDGGRLNASSGGEPASFRARASGREVRQHLKNRPQQQALGVTLVQVCAAPQGWRAAGARAETGARRGGEAHSSGRFQQVLAGHSTNPPVSPGSPREMPTTKCSKERKNRCPGGVQGGLATARAEPRTWGQAGSTAQPGRSVDASLTQSPAESPRPRPAEQRRRRRPTEAPSQTQEAGRGHGPGPATGSAS